MIGGATMGTVLPTPAPSADAAPSASEPGSPPTNAAPADPASAKPAKTAAQDNAAGRTQAPGDDASDFDRLLEPDGGTAAASADAPEKPRAATDAGAGTRGAAPSAPPNPSLADQLLGLLGLLGTAAAAPAPPTAPQAMGTPAPAVPARATTTATTPLPARALTQAASGPALPPGVAVAVTDTAQAVQGAAMAAEFIVDPASRDASASTGGDLNAIAARDPTPLSAPVPLPTPSDKLPSVPQPALMQPANPNAGYGDDLGSSVVWMAEHRVGHAALQVSPDHLGPIEVRLQIDGARVHAEFFSAQPDVRHALEASLPRLRDLLGQQGLQLGQADVGQRQRHDAPRAQSSGNGQGDCFPDDPRPLPATLRRARGLVDEYA